LPPNRKNSRRREFNMPEVKIAPSILASDFLSLKDQIKLVEQGGADWLHLDVMDGHFVPNITIGPPIVKSIRSHTSLPLDVHLMIEDPDRYLEAFRQAGADHITVHQEACTHLHRTIGRIKELGAVAGVALNPATPVALLRDIIQDVDLVLIMSVNPGFGGQRFIPDCVRRISEANALAQSVGKQIYIEVDGGIDPTTAMAVVQAGANALVAGTAIFRQGDIVNAVARLRKSCSA
jgi:ribulose-phosphate 3-epimerase